MPNRGDEREAAPSTTASTLVAINGYLETGGKRLEILGLKKWWLRWANLPYAELASSITPNLLHQMQRKLGISAVDDHFKSMTRAKGLRDFKKGISMVQQWTRREAKGMQMVFVPMLANHPHSPNHLVAFMRALIDFSYIALVKRGWAASNKRDAIPQIIDYCQRLEALRIHRAHLDEYYRWLYNPEEHGDNEEEGWEDDNDMDGEDEGVGLRKATSASDANAEVEYPWPEFAIAARATHRVTLPELVQHHGAVIRVRSPQHDSRSRQLRTVEPAFDTALFLYDSRQFGLLREFSMLFFPWLGLFDM
ncbi:hypothetical protein FRC09_020052 [Ceratobasidium sp. 395]|nr:hypothetical protein FRC09_020052 [Ceratobasidium sp. 395]